MDILTIVFVCHDDESIKKVIGHKHPIIFVGNKPISDEFRNNKDIIIARDLKYNIENEPKLLTFTAWYAIIKNDLFSSYKYICVFEYDVYFNNSLIGELNSVCNLNTVDVISFFNIKEDYYFWRDINKRVLLNFLDRKNITLDMNEKVEWYYTSNQCLRRSVLENFVDWYYPDCLEIKLNDNYNFSWYHERVFSLYIRSKSQDIKHFTINGLTHFESNSHREINTINNKKYILIYNDGLYKNHIDKLVDSIKTHSDFIVIIYDKSDIDPNFRDEYKRILDSKRGGGYWLWKPYIINKTLSKIDTGDYLFYIDSRYYFVENFAQLYSSKIKNDDIILWSNKPNETTNYMKNYCKMDVVNKYNMNDLVYNKNAIECWAGAFFLRKTSFTEKIMDEWFSMCKIYEDISDSPSLQKSPTFMDHRHDQSLLSIIAYKYNIKLHFFEKKYLQNVRIPWTNKIFNHKIVEVNNMSIFSIYPSDLKLVNDWNFYTNPCKNSRELMKEKNGVIIYQCRCNV